MNRELYVLIALILGLLIMQGCATAPHNIEPAYVPLTEFMAMDCAELDSTYAFTSMELEVAEAKQVAARAKGTASNSFVLGAGLLVKSHEEEVARLKGEVRAIVYFLDRKCLTETEAKLNEED